MSNLEKWMELWKIHQKLSAAKKRAGRLEKTEQPERNNMVVDSLNDQPKVEITPFDISGFVLDEGLPELNPGEELLAASLVLRFPGSILETAENEEAQVREQLHNSIPAALASENYTLVEEMPEKYRLAMGNTRSNPETGEVTHFFSAEILLRARKENN